jgi:hypothetical protein
MTFAAVFLAGVLQKPTNGIIGPKEAKELTGGGLSKNRASAPLTARLSRSTWPNLRETSIQLFRWSVQGLGTVTTEMTTRFVADTTVGSGNTFAAPVMAGMISATSTSFRGSDERPR